jgi:pSer/pThr/pTyr-binding forkhead associated (FHA) protein
MANSWTLGNAPDCDIVVDQATVSGRHCRLSRTDAGFVLEDLGSTNGTYVNGTRITTKVPVTRKDAITLGQTIPMPWPAEEASSGKRIVRIGREPDNDVAIDLPIVSGYHARVVWDESVSRAFIEDLRSSNGTAVNDITNKISRSSISASDTIYFGSHAISAAVLLRRLDPRLFPTIAVQPGRTLLGRGAGCDRFIDDPSLSTEHARLTCTAQEIFIDDLGSANGTFVNGERVSGRRAVSPGDLVGLGSYSFVLARQRDAVTAPIPAIANVRPTAAVPAHVPPLPVVTPQPTSWVELLPPELLRVVNPPWRILILFGQALLITVVVAAVLGMTSSNQPAGAAGLAAVSASWLGLLAIWFGLSNGVVGAAALSKTRAVSQSDEVFARFVACFGLLGTLSLIQTGVAWAAVSLATGAVGSALPALGMLAVASGAGLGLGLVIASLTPRPLYGVAVLPFVMLMFWLLGGEFQAAARMPSWAQAASNAMPSRWAFEGLFLLESDRRASAALPDLGQASEPPIAIRDIAEDYFPAETFRMGVSADVIALSAFLIGLVALAAFIAAGRLPPRPQRAS